MIETGTIKNKFYENLACLQNYIQTVCKILFVFAVKIKLFSTKISISIYHFLSIYSWYPSLISLLFVFFFSIAVIFFSKDIGAHAIEEEVRKIINDNLHTFFLTLSGSIITIALYVGASSGRDSSFDRSRVLFKTFMLFPLIVMISINAISSLFITSRKSNYFLCVFDDINFISMVKLFDSILNRQQFENQRKIIAESSMKILHPFLRVPQKIITSELSAFASECHLHLSSNNITFAQSSMDSLRDLTISLRVLIKGVLCQTRRYGMAVSLYKDAIGLCNQIMLSATEDCR